jgi:hypothetical protein
MNVPRPTDPKTGVAKSKGGRGHRLAGFILAMWGFALGLSDLAVFARVDDWLDRGDIGTLSACYTGALILGVALTPLLSFGFKRSMLLGGVLSALPVGAIGLGIEYLPKSLLLVVACVLFGLSALGSGIVDNTQLSRAVKHSTGGKPDAIRIFGIRRMGALLAGIAAAITVGLHMSAAMHYVVLAVILLVPVVVTLVTPDLPETEPDNKPEPVQEPVPVPVTAKVSGLRMWWVVVCMGALVAASMQLVLLMWSYGVSIMKEELHAGQTLALAAPIFFAAVQGVSCFTFYGRFGTRPTRSLVLSGLRISTAGTAVLIAAAALAHLPSHDRLPVWMAQALVLGGLALLGWGIGSLPLTIMGHVTDLPLKLSHGARMSLTVVVQCILMTMVNKGFGYATGEFGAFDLFVVAAVLCMAGLMFGMRRILRPATA